MNTNKDAASAQESKQKPGKKAIVGMGLLFFIILCAIALAICNFRVQYATQTILSQQKDVQQTWMDKSLDAIRVWRNELLDQARFISSSEMFRLFVIDAKSLSPKELSQLANPDSLSHPDEALRSLAEQYTYIQDLLKDFTKRRAWNDARILLPGGEPMVEPAFSVPLSGMQSELARKAAEKGQAIFGPLRRGENGLYLDMADPLYDVLGKDEQKVVAVLLLSLPMDRALSTFLARNSEQADSEMPRIINREGDNLYMALAFGGRIALEPVAGDVKLEAMPFMLRPALDGKGSVYSMGGMPTGLDWVYALETPAANVETLIHEQKLQIYGLGILSSIGIALLGAWLWAGHMSRKHEADAIRYEKLYNTISNQKMMLDSINASFKAGMILVDQHGRVQMSNPAFRKMFDPQKEIPLNTPLVECMDSRSAITLLEDMSRVNTVGQSASVELPIPSYSLDKDCKMDTRLYRITIYPYSDTTTDAHKFAGSVAVFQDITEFRKKALAEKEKAQAEQHRQTALISAFVRAVESVDPNLPGHSDKMTGIADMLARELQLDEKQTQTLLLAAKLSQVGKIFVPRELLIKQDKLTPDELKELRRAPEYADKILNDLKFDLPVRETVRLIGERVDGSGKPLGLIKENISLEGRTLAVVNAFIAMTSSRAWRKDGGMSIEDAIRQLANDPGFDHDIVHALASLSKIDIQKIIAPAL